MDQNLTGVDGGLWPFGSSKVGGIVSLLGALLAAGMVLALLSFARVFLQVLKELFLFWNITLSRSSHKLKKPLRLHSYLCETSYLDEVGVNELYNFIVEDFHVKKGASVDMIRKLLQQYTHILMCRDRLDGTLRGILLLGIERKGDYTLLKTGLTSFKNYYRGSPFIKIIIAWLSFREMLRHPLTPVYAIGKLYSFTAYLKIVTSNEFYPVYNKETPENFKKIFADFAAAVLVAKGGEARYNPETFVIEQDANHLEDNLTVLREGDLRNPHIKFFVERNPGWKEGHCLVVGCRVSWKDFFMTIQHTLSKVLSRKSRTRVAKDSTAKRPAPPKLLKRRTFQQLDANTFAVNSLDYDMMGEAVLSPSSKAAFVFQTDADVADHHQMDIDVNGL